MHTRTFSHTHTLSKVSILHIGLIDHLVPFWLAAKSSCHAYQPTICMCGVWRVLVKSDSSAHNIACLTAKQLDRPTMTFVLIVSRESLHSVSQKSRTVQTNLLNTKLTAVCVCVSFVWACCAWVRMSPICFSYLLSYNLPPRPTGRHPSRSDAKSTVNLAESKEHRPEQT